MCGALAFGSGHRVAWAGGARVGGRAEGVIYFMGAQVGQGSTQHIHIYICILVDTCRHMPWRQGLKL